MKRRNLLLAGLVATAACYGDTPAPPDAGSVPDTASAPDIAPTPDSTSVEDAPPPPLPTEAEIEVLVLIDGAPSPDTRVVQGGAFDREWFTGADGRTTATLDLEVPGDHFVMASHPEARVRGRHYDAVAHAAAPLTIELTRFDPSDNVDYVYKDPGEPDQSHVIEKCGHCHDTVDRSWFDSAHRTSASNPQLQDLYPEVAAMGTSGACADCHAPGIDGVPGGRDLRDATGYAQDYGVHCEVCHHVESVDLDAPAGVAGRLHIVRPSEIAPFEGVGTYLPLLFCANHDIANLYMGCVQRDHFREASLCAGCHELDQTPLVPELAPDPTRWPDGRLPVHSTYSEWLLHGPGPALPCQGCHMPFADASVLNSGDLQLWGLGNTGVTGGWPRPPNNTRLHTFAGPRSPAADRLPSPAALSLTSAVAAGTLTVTATVSAAGAGHAVPTGEPMRSLVLVVEATCDGAPLDPTGGDVVPAFGGHLARQEAAGDWSTWPGAQPGQVVYVTTRPGDHHDYLGFGPFGDGTFDAAAKGLPVEHLVGARAITGVDGDAVTFDAPLPAGDVAYLAPAPGDPSARATAGHPGFAFARVLTDAAGEPNAPHFRATDVAVDNRLLPGQQWTTSHSFAAPCEAPVATATLLYRALPASLARARGWALRDTVLATATK